MTSQVPALEGGSPVRSGSPVPFFRAELNEEDIQAVVDTLRSGWLTLGPRTAAFEAACAESLQCSEALATNSCTSALFLAMKSFGIGPGDEVIVPSMTFASSVNTIVHVGAEPVLADIELQSYGIDPHEVTQLLTPRTRAILAVDYAGQPCRLPELLAAAHPNGLVVIEDAAHAFGAALAGRPVGCWSDVTAFSFYATKCITTGEGGLLTFADEEVAQRARLLSHHGMQRDAWQRYSDRGSWYYEVETVGYKFNMTDVQAALGLSQLRRSESLREARTRIASTYNEVLAALPGVRLPETRDEARHAWHLYVIRLQAERLRVDRNHFARALRAEGIVPSVHFIPYHRHPAGRSLQVRRPLRLTETFADECLSLPLFPGMHDDEVQDVVAAVTKLVRYYGR